MDDKLAHFLSIFQDTNLNDCAMIDLVVFNNLNIYLIFGSGCDLIEVRFIIENRFKTMKYENHKL